MINIAGVPPIGLGRLGDREVQVGYLAQCTRILFLVLVFCFFFFFSFSFSFFLGVHGFHIHGFYTERARLAGVELQHSTCKTEYESGGYAFSLFFSFSICIFNVFYFSFSFSFFVFSFFFLFQVYTASAYTASTQNVQDQLGQNSSVLAFRAHGFHTERARLAGVEFQHSTCKTRVHYLFIN